MQIVRAKPEDADALTEIAHAAKRHWGYPERWIESWRDILTMRPEFIAANVAYSAMEDDRAVGFYLLTTESDGMHLDHLWIAPHAMGRGIGRALFEHAVEEARGSATERSKSKPIRTRKVFTRAWERDAWAKPSPEIEGQRRELPLALRLTNEAFA